MKLILTLLFFACSMFAVQAQVKFLSRFEVQGQPYDPVFEMMRIPNGLVVFRTYQARNLSSEKVFQFFKTNQDLKSDALIELNLRPGFDMIGYDIEGNDLFVLMAKGSNSNADKYILQVDLETSQGFEFSVNNLLSIELVEFLVQKRKAVFMGNAESRPVLQIYDLDDKSIHTVQGIYNNNSEVLQIRKMSELESLEVVVSKRGQYKNRETSIFTFDLEGNLVREVKVDQFGEAGQEILEGLLLADQNYQQVMIGSFGLDGRNSYQGVYIMEINEFGEYEFKLYTLEDFPNFYNYLPEKQKAKQDQSVLNDLEKSKIPSIGNTFSIRDVRETEDAYYLYFDQVNIVNYRGGRSGTFSPSSAYRYDRMNRIGYAPTLSGMVVLPNDLSQAFTITNEFQYEAAHFIKISKEGQVLWDNSATYDDFVTDYPEAFGEIAIVGDDLFHLYVENDKIMASFFRNGEKVFEHLSFDLELRDEGDRLKNTDLSTLRLAHWYDRYYILSGQQSIRFLNSDNREEVRDVFFMAKILVDGDLYQPEEVQD